MQQCQRLAGLNIPHSNDPVDSSASKLPTILRERQSVDHAGLALEGGELAPELRLPQAYRVATAAGQQAPVTGECHVINQPVVPLQRGNGTAARRVPEPHGRISATARDQPSIL